MNELIKEIAEIVEVNDTGHRDMSRKTYIDSAKEIIALCQQDFLKRALEVIKAELEWKNDRHQNSSFISREGVVDDLKAEFEIWGYPDRWPEIKKVIDKKNKKRL